MMLVSLQDEADARVELNVTVFDPCDDPNPLPLIVTLVPTIPEVVDRVLMDGLACANAVFAKIKVVQVKARENSALSIRLFIRRIAPQGPAAFERYR